MIHKARAPSKYVLPSKITLIDGLSLSSSVIRYFSCSPMKGMSEKGNENVRCSDLSSNIGLSRFALKNGIPVCSRLVATPICFKCSMCETAPLKPV